jgi:hypothetical protein
VCTPIALLPQLLSQLHNTQSNITKLLVVARTGRRASINDIRLHQGNQPTLESIQPAFFHKFKYFSDLCRCEQAQEERAAQDARVQQLNIQLQAAKDQLAAERAAWAEARAADSRQSREESLLQERLQESEQKHQEQKATIALLGCANERCSITRKISKGLSLFETLVCRCVFHQR